MVMKEAEYIQDCESLPSSKLRQKYKTEACSHRAMLDRRKDGAVVATELLKFRDFLRLMGPCPEPGYTVDRLNSNDPEYAPSKIRWSSKKEQSRNRRNVILLKDADGTELPLSEWAQRTGQSRHTLHARRKRGFSDAEVIHGRGHATKVDGSSETFHWPVGFEDRFERRFNDPGSFYLRPKGVATRAEFLLMQCMLEYHSLRDQVERSVPPDIETAKIDAEQEKLMNAWEFWGHELRTACRLAGPILTSYYLGLLGRMGLLCEKEVEPIRVNPTSDSYVPLPLSQIFRRITSN
jgi:hypothetical protein